MIVPAGSMLLVASALAKGNSHSKVIANPPYFQAAYFFATYLNRE